MDREDWFYYFYYWSSRSPVQVCFQSTGFFFLFLFFSSSFFFFWPVTLIFKVDTDVIQLLLYPKFCVNVVVAGSEIYIVTLKAIAWKIQHRFQIHDLRICLRPLGVLSWMSVMALLRLIHNICHNLPLSEYSILPLKSTGNHYMK